MLNHNQFSSKAQIDSLLNTAIDVDCSGTVLIDPKGVITFANRSFAGMFNKISSEMVGSHVFDAYVDSVPSRLPDVVHSGKALVGDMHYLAGRYMVVDRTPIYINGKIAGALGKVVFKDLQDFNKMYKNIYNKIRNNSLNTGTDSHPSIKYTLDHITGRSPQIVELKQSINKIALHNSTVLIRGECGTGKELFAQAIHGSSFRRNQAFIKVNCAAIPEHLLESELFGYEEGAFTGARKGGKIGKFELADNGTIFLDEIGEMSFNMQAKLLRVLQEKEIEPLGGDKTKNVDVRIIAATNANLEGLMKAGKFRQDLYYRLNVVALNIPPLRDRKEDIDLLVDQFTKKLNESFSLNVEKVSPEVIELFKIYNWPGNIRELGNIMEQAFNFVDGNVITMEEINRYLPHSAFKEERGSIEEKALMFGELKLTADGGNTDFQKDFNKRSLVEIMDSAEKKMIVKALIESRGNKSRAAQILGLSRAGLYKKLAKYQIEA